MENENYVGYLKFYGKNIENGIIQADIAGQALIGFDECIRFFNKKQNPEIILYDYKIPVITEKGSWVVWVLGSMAGIFGTAYLKKAGEKMAEKDFQDIGFSDFFRKSLLALKNLVDLIKHKKGNINWENEDFHIEQKNDSFFVSIKNESGESRTYLIPYGSRMKVQDGQVVEPGDALTEGSVNPHDILKIKGVRAVQDYMIQEVQRVYRLQGVEINDKHVEVIVRQMLKKVKIEESNDSDVLPGVSMDVLEFNDMNEKLIEEGKTPAEGKQVMLGITKASLATDSFLSAASFQETTKVLTEAAINGKVDSLYGLKENVILGKLIPAGTGMKRYRNVKLSTEVAEEETSDAAVVQ